MMWLLKYDYTKYEHFKKFTVQWIFYKQTLKYTEDNSSWQKNIKKLTINVYRLFPWKKKSLTLKQKLWKALKPGTNHLYTTNIHGRGAQTRATFLLKGSVAGSWALPAQHLLSSVATTGYSTPRLRPQAHLAAAGRAQAHTPCRAVLVPCQWHWDLLECVKLRTCPGSGKWISASRSLNALSVWMGPVYQAGSARLRVEGISSSF